MCPKAYRDLEEIYRYISETIQMTEYAEGQVVRLEEGIFSVEEFQHCGAKRQHGSYAGQGYGELFVDNYEIIYKVQERKRQVDIVIV